MTALPWQWRSKRLVLGIINYIAEQDTDTTRAKVLWVEVVDAFTDEDHRYDTVEKVLYELAVFGVIQRIGKPAAGRRNVDTRALSITTLGRAWLEGDTIPLPTIEDED